MEFKHDSRLRTRNTDYHQILPVWNLNGTYQLARRQIIHQILPVWNLNSTLPETALDEERSNLTSMEFKPRNYP